LAIGVHIIQIQIVVAEIIDYSTDYTVPSQKLLFFVFILNI